jgi:hypothetical protein
MPDPASVSGLILWVEDSGLYTDAAATIPCSGSGDPVQVWQDKSPAGHNLNEPVFQPNYHPSGINSLPSVYGSNGNRLLRNASLGNGLTDFTIFIVFKAGETIGNYERLVDKKYDTGFILFRDGTNANRWGAKLLNDDPTMLVLTLDDAFPHVIMYQRDGSNLYLTGDGETNGATAGGAPVASLGTDPFTTHAYDNGGNPNSGFFGDIGSVVFYNKALSAGERSTVWNYLGPKWGVTLAGVGGAGGSPPRFIVESLALNPLRGVY